MSENAGTCVQCGQWEDDLWPGSLCETCAWHSKREEEENQPEVQTCQPEHPYKPDMRGRWFHPFATEIGSQRDGYPGGDCVTVKCPICGHQWEEELPQ